MVPHLTEYDPAGLTWQWEFAHPESEILCKQLERIASVASDCGQHFAATLGQMRETVEQLTGVELGEMRQGKTAPRLTESWFCCAEPTESQMVRIGPGSIPLS